MDTTSALVLVDAEPTDAADVLVKRTERMSAYVAAILLHLIVVVSLVNTQVFFLHGGEPLEPTDDSIRNQLVRNMAFREGEPYRSGMPSRSRFCKQGNLLPAMQQIG